MKTSRSLDSYSFKELCALAERLGLKRWTHLRKEGLLEFLQEHVERENKPAKRGRPKANKAETVEAETGATTGKKTRKTANKAEAGEVETTASRKTRKTANKVETNEAETKAPAGKKTRKTANKTEAGEAETQASASKKTRGSARGDAKTAETVATKTVGKVAKTSSPTESVAEAPKRRGRPKKAVAAESQPTLFDVKGASEPESEVVKSKRRRRPRNVEVVENVDVAENAEVAPKRKRRARIVEETPVEETPVDVVEPEKKSRRGRKKQAVTVTEPSVEPVVEVVEDSAPKKTRKRAIKAKPVDAEVETPKVESDVEPPKKKRGRKSAAEKQALFAEATKSVVEEKAAEEKAVEEKPVEVVAPPKKRRGRKPKNVESVAPTPEEAASEAVAPIETVSEESVASVVEEAPEEAKEEASKKRGRRKKAAEEPVLPAWAVEEDEKSDSWNDEDEKRSSSWDDEDDDDDDEDDDLDDDVVEEESPEIGTSKQKTEPEPPPAAPAEPASEQALALKEKLLSRKIVGSPNDRVDRLVLFVCDSFWLRACWEITPLLVDRVRSAMGRHWYTADPALRVFYVDRDGPGATGRRELVSEIEIRGGVDNWYVPVDNPPSCFMVELGYRSRDGQFFTLVSSNTVQTPQRFVHDSFGRSTIDDLNSRVRWDSSTTGSGYPAKSTISKSGPKPAASEAFPAATGFNRTDVDDKSISDEFYVDAEVVVKGHAPVNTSLSIKDEPIPLRPDGTFSVRYSLPERRHVFPVVMSSRDGMETQTIVLSVDRNTKKLDPVFKEDDED